MTTEVAGKGVTKLGFITNINYFEFLFDLYRIWLCDKEFKKVPSSSEVTYKKAFNLRQNMLLFVQNLEYYMFEEVIETQWHTFMSAINKKVLIL